MDRKLTRALILAAALMIMFIMPCAWAEDADDDRPTPAFWVTVERRAGRVVDSVSEINIRSGPGTDYDKIGKLGPGDMVEVLSIYNPSWYHIRVDGLEGYASANYITLTTVADQIPGYDEPDIAVDQTDLNVPYIFQEDDTIALSGTLHATRPVLVVRVEVYDLRKLRTAMDVVVTYDRQDDVRLIDLGALASQLNLQSLAAGEKRLNVTLTGSNGSTVTVSRDFYVTGWYSSVAHMTAACEISLPGGVPEEMYDENYGTYWAPGERDVMSLTLPQGRVGALFVVEWVRPPDAFEIRQYDENDQEIDVVSETNPSRMIVMTYRLDERTRRITLQTSSGNKRIAELRVIERGRVSPQLMQWTPLPEKVDILVVSTHQDDELLFLGGTIPYYAATGKVVAVCYMATCSRYRLQEAMEGLWSCGLRYHPIFLGYRDVYAETLNEAQAAWGDRALEDLVRIIRRYRPEVVVTQDVNGEYGHRQHQLTSRLVRQAVDRSWDFNYYPESYDQYGAWEVKKTYIHLYEENQIYMNCYDTPLETLGGLSALQAATVGYAKHISQHGHYQMNNQGTRFDNKLFGIYRTSVGYDEAGNDMFEHIPE